MRFFYIFSVLLFSFSSFSDVVTVNGNAIEMGSRRALKEVKLFFIPKQSPGKEVKEKEKPTTVLTSKKGEFSVQLDENKTYRLIVNLAGYKKYEEEIKVKEGRVFKVYVEKIEYNLFETTIVAKADKRDLTKKSLTYEDFYSTPGAGGDPVKAVANLPGINRSTQGARVVIQGGAPDDTQYGVNQQYVPIIFHFGGLTSVIMPEAIQSVDYLSAGFGPEYGKAIGGIINLNTRTPRTDRYYGIGFLDIFNGGLLAEGKAGEKGSFIFSTRRSWVGEVLKKIAEDNEDFDFTVAPTYTDATLVYEYNKNKNLKYSLTGLYSQDELKFVLDMPAGNDPSTRGAFKNETGFTRLISRMDHKLDSKTKYFSSLSVGADNIFFQINDQYLDIDSTNLNLRTEYQKKGAQWTNYYGLDWSFEDYDVEINLPFFDDDNGEINNPFSLGDSQKGEISGLWYELGFYSRHQYQKSKNSPWIFSPTLRLDYYKATELGESFFNKLLWQPRVSVQYKLSDFNYFKLATGIYNQLPQEREVNSLSGNPYLNPLVARHLNFGYEDDLRRGGSDGVKLYTGVFFKDLDNLINTSSRRVNRGGEFVTENFANGSSGVIYGGEAYVQYSNGPWKFNSSYTISKSERTDEDGVTTVSEFDQTHNLNLLASYQYERWTFSSRLRLTTGNPRTPVTGSVYDADNDVYVPIRGEFFSKRDPFFFQLDLRVDRKYIYRDWILSVYFDVQNATNRANPEGLNYNYDYSKSKLTSGIPVLPTFGLKGEF